MKVMGTTWNFGDVERVEIPDPDNYDKFIEAAQIRGATERVTTSIEGRYALDLISELLRLGAIGCSLDVQLHMGQCTDPSAFNTFKKAVIFENADITGWSTEDLGALASDENAVINETAEISAEIVYEAVPVVIQTVAGSTVTNEVLDITFCDNVSCGECDETSDGCQTVFAITKAAGGSPTTPADVVYSIDSGSTFYAHDIDSMGNSDDPTGVDCLGDNLVVISNDTNSLHYAPLSEFDTVTDPTFTEVTTGFVTGGEPNDIYTVGRYSFVVGDGGYVYGTSDASSGVTVLDSGEATVDDLYRVHAISDEFAVAVGENGSVIWTENGTIWGAVPTRPVGYGVSINALFVKSELEWWVGADNGRLYYTNDKGTTWTEKTFSGSGAGEVYDIVFATDSIAYLSHATATPAGRILRSYDGGYSWNILPEGSQTIPSNDYLNRIAVCDAAPEQVAANFFLAGGLADDASDGIMMVGQPS
jgi:photosystem II stability/assembly factor-like uncharacterized protein